MATHFQPADRHRFESAIRRFDEENAHDPNRELVDGELRPRELAYSHWLTDWVLRLCPTASEELRLAARSQHLCRWKLPRETYPMSRQGYLRWREALKQLHAENSGKILSELGYPKETVDRVQQLNLKRNFPGDPESRVLEDALCLVFLERQFPALAAKTSEEKVLNALQKSWKKMTAEAREIAKSLSYGPQERELLKRALQEAC